MRLPGLVRGDYRGKFFRKGKVLSMSFSTGTLNSKGLRKNLSATITFLSKSAAHAVKWHTFHQFHRLECEWLNNISPLVPKA